MAKDLGPTASNVDQLRDRIDQGKTGEKVYFPDPAAASLGTDGEAAGASVTRRKLAFDAGSAAKAAASEGSHGGDGPALAVYIGLIVLLALAFVAILAWSLLHR